MADSEALNVLTESLRRKRIDIESVKHALKNLTIETPTWAYGDSGTRFKVFKQPGAARNIFEKLQDAACVHQYTGVTPSVAVHVLWDFADCDADEVRNFAESLGIRIGAVNPTLFEQDEYRFGSIANPAPAVRQKAVAHMLDAIDIMRRCDCKYLSLWLADGTNYPGQDDFRRRKRRAAENLRKVNDALDDSMEMLIEYKFFEPAFYATDIADWGMAYVLAKSSGPKAKVLVDLGHHPHGTNIEQIVAFLIDENMLGGFHFNSRKYADDDLTTGSLNPYELFLIFNELVAAGGGGRLYDVPYTIDQSHNVKPKIEAMIQSVMNIQATCAKALCVDRPALRDAQDRCDVTAAEAIFKDAFYTDVRPLLGLVRGEMGLQADPLQAYRQSGHFEKIANERS